MILLDGAAGTTLWKIAEQNGAKKDDTWKYNIEHPDFVTCLHRKMIGAGAQIIITNTLAASPPVVKNRSEYETRDIITRGVELAKESAEGTGVRVALSLGPVPMLLEPYGDLTKEEAKRLYHEMLKSGVEAGADMFFLATFTDLEMMQIAAREARKYPIPLYCMFSFEKNNKTIMGQTVSDICQGLSKIGIDGIGANCSLGPQEMLPVIRDFSENTDLPLIIKPNAGMPGHVQSPENFAEILRPAFPLVNFIGGCCNCDERYIVERRKML